MTKKGSMQCEGEKQSSAKYMKVLSSNGLEKYVFRAVQSTRQLISLTSCAPRCPAWICQATTRSTGGSDMMRALPLWVVGVGVDGGGTTPPGAAGGASFFRRCCGL